MANTASRLSANGSLTINGTFDEVTGPISKNGLIGYWDMQYSYSSNTNYWFDQSGLNNHIDLVGGGSVTQTTGNINFFYANASYGLVTIPQLAGASTVTVEAIMKSPISGGMLFGFGRYDVYTAGSHLGYNTAQGDIYGLTSTQIDALNIRNKYTHYVFVMTSSGTISTSNEIWINGVKQTLTQVSGITTTGPTFNYYGSYDLLLNGWAIPGQYREYKNDVSFANLKIYNRQLTAKEIVQNYNVYAPRFGLTKIGTNPVSTLIANNTSQTIIQAISGEFDEVTYNPNSNLTTNFYYSSQNFSSGNWSKTNATVTTVNLTANTTAPDGTNTAFKIVENVTTGNKEINQGFFVTTGNIYTMSVYVKSAERNTFRFGLASDFMPAFSVAYFNLATGSMVYNTTFINTTITNVGNGWYRCSGTFSPIKTGNMTTYITLSNNNGSTDTNYSGDGLSGLYVWGAQVELSNGVGIYVPTNDSRVLVNNFNQRTTNTGNTFIKGSYDEYSKMSPITEGLIFNVDPGYEGSYVGSGAAMYDTTSNRYKVDLLGNSTPKYSSDFGGILKFTSTFSNNEYAVTNFPSGRITPTSNYTMSAWVKFNRSNSGLAEYQFNNPVTGAVVSPQANTGYSYGSAGTILGTNYYGDYGLFWYSQIRNAGAKEILVGFQNRVTPYAEASPQLTYTMNDSLIFFNWTHIVGVLNNAGNFAGFYVNGVLVNSTTASQIASGSFPYSFPTVRICADNVAGGNALGRNFDGDTGPMSIWNRALSATEIQQMYNSQRSRFGV